MALMCRTTPSATRMHHAQRSFANVSRPRKHTIPRASTNVHGETAATLGDTPSALGADDAHGSLGAAVAHLVARAALLCTVVAVAVIEATA